MSGYQRAPVVMRDHAVYSWAYPAAADGTTRVTLSLYRGRFSLSGRFVLLRSESTFRPGDPEMGRLTERTFHTRAAANRAFRRAASAEFFNEYLMNRVYRKQAPAWLD